MTYIHYLVIIIMMIAFNASAAEWPATAPDCLAANIYHEARSESLAGQYMIAYVTMNRVYSPNFPNTICGVVKQKNQFSWYNPKENNYPTEVSAWKKACSVATKFLLRMPISGIDLSEGALYYHADYVHPKWALKKNFIGRVGSHLFYR